MTCERIADRGVMAGEGQFAGSTINAESDVAGFPWGLIFSQPLTCPSLPPWVEISVSRDGINHVAFDHDVGRVVTNSSNFFAFLQIFGGLQ